MKIKHIEIPDIRLGFIPVGERDLNDNILIDILIEKVRVVEKQARAGRKRIVERGEDCGLTSVSRPDDAVESPFHPPGKGFDAAKVADFYVLDLQGSSSIVS